MELYASTSSGDLTSDAGKGYLAFLRSVDSAFYSKTPIEPIWDMKNRAYLSDKKKDSKTGVTTRAAKKDRTNIVRYFCRLVRERLDACGGSEDDELTPPLCELGYATNLDRLTQHEKHDSSNYLMNMAEAVCRITKGLEGYRIAQHPISLVWRRPHASSGELLFSRLTQAYDDNGGGFSHHGAGLSHGGANKFEVQQWVIWTTEELTNGQIQKSRERDLRKHYALLEALKEEISKRQRGWAVHDALALQDTKARQDAIDALNEKQKKEHLAELDDMRKNLPAWIRAADLLVELTPLVRRTETEINKILLEQIATIGEHSSEQPSLKELLDEIESSSSDDVDDEPGDDDDEEEDEVQETVQAEVDMDMDIDVDVDVDVDVQGMSLADVEEDVVGTSIADVEENMEGTSIAAVEEDVVDPSIATIDNDLIEYAPRRKGKRRRMPFVDIDDIEVADEVEHPVARVIRQKKMKGGSEMEFLVEWRHKDGQDWVSAEIAGHEAIVKYQAGMAVFDIPSD